MNEEKTIRRKELIVHDIESVLFKTIEIVQLDLVLQSLKVFLSERCCEQITEISRKNFEKKTEEKKNKSMT